MSAYLTVRPQGLSFRSEAGAFGQCFDLVCGHRSTLSLHVAPNRDVDEPCWTLITPHSRGSSNSAITLPTFTLRDTTY